MTEAARKGAAPVRSAESKPARARQPPGQPPAQNSTIPDTAAPAAPAKLSYDDAFIRSILRQVRTIAAVGSSILRWSWTMVLTLRCIPPGAPQAGLKTFGFSGSSYVPLTFGWDRH